jgi:hypothetical protein
MKSATIGWAGVLKEVVATIFGMAAIILIEW